MSKYTKEDIFQIVEDEDVAFIRLQFCDLFGVPKNIAIPSSQLEKALKQAGFSSVLEVALGADICADKEAKEFEERKLLI